MRRPLGLGPIRIDQPFTATTPLVVRQAAALAVGCFVFLIMLLMGVGVLLEPGTTVNSGNAFLDRWVIGIIIVPALWGLDRFLIRPRVRVDEDGVELHNPLRTTVARWPAVLGAGFDTHLRLVLADGDTVSSVLFGPALSSPVTRRNRVEQLVEVVNAESARRAGRHRDTAAAYEAEALVGNDPTAATGPKGPGAGFRPMLGLVNLAGYVAGWTLACILAAVLS